MIRYKNVLQMLKEAGFTTYRLRACSILTPSTIQRLQSGRPVSTKTIETLCLLLHCQPGDIMEVDYDKNTLGENPSVTDIVSYIHMNKHLLAAGDDEDDE